MDVRHVAIQDNPPPSRAPLARGNEELFGPQKPNLDAAGGCACRQKYSPSRSRFRPPYRVTLRFRVLPPGAASPTCAACSAQQRVPRIRRQGGRRRRRETIADLTWTATQPLYVSLGDSLRLLRPRRRGDQAQIEPPREHVAPVRAQLARRSRSSSSLASEPGPSRLEGVGVGRNLPPLLGDLDRELEVELEALGPASPAEGLVRVHGRSCQERCSAREIEGVFVPLE